MPAKYWYHNKLNSNDKIIGTKFYEFGFSHRYWPLHYLNNLPVDTNLEVILVDYSEQNPPVGLDCGALKKCDHKSKVLKLAAFVSSTLGGAVEFNMYNHTSYEADMNKLKFELRSNVIPLSKLHHGVTRHRALLFKACADLVDLPCSLERSTYWGKSHVWNTITLQEDVKFIIDLMHNVGQLYEPGSSEGQMYKRNGN